MAKFLENNWEMGASLFFKVHIGSTNVGGTWKLNQSIIVIIDPEISSRQGNILLRITNVCCIVAYCIYVMRRILIFFKLHI